MNRIALSIGGLVTVLLVTVLMAGLGRDPKHIDSPLIGQAAPPFALKRAGSGEPIDLAAFRGKPVVVNFWATWCAPCWEEHPILNETSRQFGDRVQFLGVMFQMTRQRSSDSCSSAAPRIRP